MNPADWNSCPEWFINQREAEIVAGTGTDHVSNQLGHNLVALLPVLHVLPGGLWIDGKVNSFKSTRLHSLFESGGHEDMVRNSGSPPVMMIVVQ